MKVKINILLDEHDDPGKLKALLNVFSGEVKIETQQKAEDTKVAEAPKAKAKEPVKKTTPETAKEPEKEVTKEPEKEVTQETTKEDVKHGITVENVREVLATKIDNFRTEIKAKLTELKAPNVTSLKSEHYPAFIEFLNGLK